MAMRNIRRDGMDYVKKLKKNNEVTEDDQKKAEKDLQDMLDKYIKKVDAALAAKDKELMSNRSQTTPPVRAGGVQPLRRKRSL